MTRHTDLCPLEEAAEFVGVSDREFKRLVRQGLIRYCCNLSTPISEVFVLRRSIEVQLYAQPPSDSVQQVAGFDDQSTSSNCMYITASDVIKDHAYLGYLSYPDVHEPGAEINNYWSESTYHACVFENFNGEKFSVYELDQVDEKDWTIQANKPISFPFTLGNDLLLEAPTFSYEELYKVKPRVLSEVASASWRPPKIWATKEDFWKDEDIDASGWVYQDRMESWMQVSLPERFRSSNEVLFKALNLYFRFRPDAPDPNIDELLSFMDGYDPASHKGNPADYWQMKKVQGGYEFKGEDSDVIKSRSNLKTSLKTLLNRRLRPA